MLQIDAASHIPPFEQIIVQVLAEIESGMLRPGDRLPTVRQLAADLGLAPNTVARSYSELEQSGAIVTRGRRGSFIAPRATDDRLPVSAHAAAGVFVNELKRLDVGLDDALRLVHGHWH